MILDTSLTKGNEEAGGKISPETRKLLINGSLWDTRFYPAYTPKEMLDMGVFGGTYLNSVRDQLPFEWFTGDNVLPKGNRPDVSMNFFNVSGSGAELQLAHATLPPKVLVRICSKIEEALGIGADDYLIKSHFTPSEVIAKVNMVLKG